MRDNATSRSEGASSTAADPEGEAIKRLTAVGGKFQRLPLADGRTVSSIDLSSSSASDEDLAALADLKDLIHIGVGGGRITDAAMVQLAFVQNLRSVFIDYRHGGLTLRTLLQIPSRQITSLHMVFGGGEFYRAGFPAIWGEVISIHFPKLVSLTLIGCEFQEEALAKMASLPSLRHFTAVGSLIPVTGLSHIARMAGLQILDLFGSALGGRPTGKDRATSPAFGLLAPLTGLRYLSLNDACVQDYDLGAIATLTNLQVVDLSSNPVTNVGIEQLLPLLNLRYLGLEKTSAVGPGVMGHILVSLAIANPRGAERLRQKLRGLCIVRKDARKTLSNAFTGLQETNAGNSVCASAVP